MMFDESNGLPTFETAMIPMTGQATTPDATLFRIDMDGKPAIVIKQLEFNALQLLFGVSELRLTAFDTWRIVDALMSVLRTLPLDMERPTPSPDSETGV